MLNRLIIIKWIVQAQTESVVFYSFSLDDQTTKSRKVWIWFICLLTLNLWLYFKINWYTIQYDQQKKWFGAVNKRFERSIGIRLDLNFSPVYTILVLILTLFYKFEVEFDVFPRENFLHSFNFASSHFLRSCWYYVEMHQIILEGCWFLLPRK